MKIRYLTMFNTTPIPRKVKVDYLDNDTDKVMLTEDFKVLVYDINNKKYNLPETSYVITVPEFYITDGSSIPRILWTIVHPFNTESRRGSAVHDVIYSHLYKAYPKSFADDVLQAMMIYDGASELEAKIFRDSVGAFGRGGWNK